MAVRTARLAEGVQGAANTASVMYTCPAGRTAIAKDMRFSKTSGADINLYVGVRSGPRLSWVVRRETTGSGIAFDLVCWIVLEPGDQLVLQSSSAGGYTYWISGTELEGLAPD